LAGLGVDIGVLFWLSSGLNLGTLKFVEVCGATAGVARAGGDIDLAVWSFESGMEKKGDLFEDAALKAGDTNGGDTKGGDRARFGVGPILEGGPGVLRSDVPEAAGERARAICGAAVSSSFPFA